MCVPGLTGSKSVVFDGTRGRRCLIKQTCALILLHGLMWFDRVMASKSRNTCALHKIFFRRKHWTKLFPVLQGISSDTDPQTQDFGQT